MDVVPPGERGSSGKTCPQEQKCCLRHNRIYSSTGEGRAGVKHVPTGKLEEITACFEIQAEMGMPGSLHELLQL